MSRRHRPSLTSPPAPGADDISVLTLDEVRDRLARNARVLNLSVITSPSPSAPGTNQGGTWSPVLASPRGPAYNPNSMSPAGEVALSSLTPGRNQQASNASGPITSTSSSPFLASPSAAGNAHLPRPLTIPTSATNIRRGSQSLSTSPTDTVRDRLLMVRAQLLQRERELVAESTVRDMAGLQLATGQGPGMEDEGGGESSDMARKRTGGLEMQSSPTGGVGVARIGENRGPDLRRVAGVETSGKRMALQNIRERETGARNGMILISSFFKSLAPCIRSACASTDGHRPVSETVALAARDFDIATATQLSNLAISHTSSSSPKSRRPKHLGYPESPNASNGRVRQSPISASGQARGYDPTDEIARANHLARISAFMSYKGEDGDEDDDGGGPGGAGGAGRSSRKARGGGSGGGGLDDDVDGMFDFDEQADYLGDDGYLAGTGGESRRREPGTGEVIDQWGEDDERWAEGNDDYEQDGGGGMREELEL